MSSFLSESKFDKKSGLNMINCNSNASESIISANRSREMSKKSKINTKSKSGSSN